MRKKDAFLFMMEDSRLCLYADGNNQVERGDADMKGQGRKMQEPSPQGAGGGQRLQSPGAGLALTGWRSGDSGVEYLGGVLD